MSARVHLRQMAAHGRALLGELAGRASVQVGPAASPYDVFLAPNALAINKARQEHLASLGLDLEGKRVLEVGAGIGLHTPFFLERGCTVVVTDGNADNVAEIRRRHPGLTAEPVDLERDESLQRLGQFDLVYCYGLLYHLEHPAQGLKRLSEVCTGQILLETCVSAGGFDEVLFLRDFTGNNQAVSGIGCRPTRRWVVNRLRENMGHAYMARTQPAHADFPTDWEFPPTQLLYRATFVGSRNPLALTALTEDVPSRQPALRSAG